MEAFDLTGRKNCLVGHMWPVGHRLENPGVQERAVRKGSKLAAPST